MADKLPPHKAVSRFHWTVLLVSLISYAGFMLDSYKASIPVQYLPVAGFLVATATLVVNIWFPNIKPVSFQSIGTSDGADSSGTAVDASGGTNDTSGTQ